MSVTSHGYSHSHFTPGVDMLTIVAIFADSKSARRSSAFTWIYESNAKSPYLSAGFYMLNSRAQKFFASSLWRFLRTRDKLI